MSNTKVNSGSPANGDQSANDASEQEKSRAGKATPKELFNRMYGSHHLTHHQVLNLRIGDDTPVPATVVAILKRRLDGAAKRINSLKKVVADYRVILRTRKEAVGDQLVAIDNATAKRYHYNKLIAEAKLLKAQDQFEMYKQLHREALQSNSAPVQKALTVSRADRYIKRMAPSLTRETLAAIRGSKSVSQLQTLAVSGSRAEFRLRFEELLKSSGKDLNEKLTAKPKLFTEVMVRVMAELKESAVEISGGGQ